MADFLNFAGSVGVGVGLVAAALLCIAGVALSCLSFSGTWLVVAATILVALITDGNFPGLCTIIVFAVLSAIVEAAEFAAGVWGVKRRGGSSLAGLMAVVGGLAGFVLGSYVPIFGNLIGMLIGSFGLVFAVERHRSKKTGEAASIAWGAVLGRVFMIVLKVCVTMGMTAYLFIRMAVQS